MRWQLIGRNPADAAEPPRPQKPEPSTPNLVELTSLLEEGDKNPLGLIFRFAALTGMRRGEILALLWNDVGFDRESASVRGSVRRLNKGRGMVRMTPKTERSIRLLTLPSEALDIL